MPIITKNIPLDRHIQFSDTAFREIEHDILNLLLNIQT